MLILRLNNTFDTMAEEKEFIIHKRPEVLECDVVRFQNEKEKWMAFVGLLDGKPYEIFTGLQDDDEGIILPKSVNSGKIVQHKLKASILRCSAFFMVQVLHPYMTIGKTIV